MKKEAEQICDRCKVPMRKWFNQQVHIGFSCDNCGAHKDLTPTPEGE